MIQQDEVLHSFVARVKHDDVYSFVAHVKHDDVLLEHVKCTLAHEANKFCTRILEFCIFLHAIATIL